MLYLIGLGVAVVVFGFAPPKYGLRQNNYKNYTILCGFLIAIIMGLRHPVTGSPDTWAYTVLYRNLGNFKDFSIYYDLYLDKADFIFSEWAFYYCTWLLTRVFRDPQFLILTTSVFITFSVCRFIRRNSKNVPLALMIYVCLGMFTFNMNGMRQAVCMAICLFAYEPAKKRKLIPYLIIVFIAMQFHKSAVFFAPVYLLPILKNTKGNWIVFTMGMVLFLMFSNQLFPWFNEATGKEYTSGNAATGGGLFVILLYLMGIALTILCPHALEEKNNSVALFGTIVGLTSYVSRFIYHDMMERFSYYYFYFLILLIPAAIDSLDDEEHKIVKMMFIAFALLLFSYRTVTGEFRHFTLFFLK